MTWTNIVPLMAAQMRGIYYPLLSTDSGFDWIYYRPFGTCVDFKTALKVTQSNGGVQQTNLFVSSL